MDTSPFGKAARRVGQALNQGHMDPTSDLARAIVIMRDKLRKSYLPFLLTVQATFKGKRGAQAIRDRIPLAQRSARSSEEGLNKILLGSATPSEIKQAFTNLAELEGHIAFLYRETTNDVTMRGYMREVRDLSGIPLENLRAASEAFRRYTQVAEKADTQGLASGLMGQFMSPHPAVAFGGQAGALSLLGPLAPAAAALYGLGRAGMGMYRRHAISRRPDVSMSERFHGVMSSLPEGTAPRGRISPFSFAPSPTTPGVLQFPPSAMGGGFGQGADRRQAQTIADGIFLFFNRMAYRASYTRELLRALGGKEGGTPGGSSWLETALTATAAGRIGAAGVAAKAGKGAIGAAGVAARAGKGVQVAAGAAKIGAGAAGLGLLGRAGKALGPAGRVLGTAGKFAFKAFPVLSVGIDAALGATGMASEVFGPTPTAGQRTVSGFAGALAGTGAGLGKEGWGSLAGNVGLNALKGAGVGAAIGSVVPVLGTLVGGLIGAGIGAGLALIGGQRVAKGIGSVFGMSATESPNKGLTETVDAKTASAMVAQAEAYRVNSMSPRQRALQSGEATRKADEYPHQPRPVFVPIDAPLIPYRQQDPMINTMNEGG